MYECAQRYSMLPPEIFDVGREIFDVAHFNHIYQFNHL